jgi:hypothetical protein
MAAGDNTYLESDGKSVHVTLSYPVSVHELVVVEGWVGIAGEDGESGEMVALATDDREYQFTVPAALDVAKGAIVYLEVADLTGHKPDDSAYSTTAGAGKVALFKATAAKDVNNMVTGLLLAHNALAS